MVAAVAGEGLVAQLGGPEGGVQVNVRPLAGFTALVNVIVAVFVPPAVDADQFVVVVRLLKSALLAPRKPTCG